MGAGCELGNLKLLNTCLILLSCLRLMRGRKSKMTVSTATAKSDKRPLYELAGLIERNTDADGIHATAIPRLFLIRSSRLTGPMPTVYEPSLCIVVQGRKQAMLADEVYVYGPEQFLVVSVDLPVVGHIIEATPEK